jgi:hypothetical protein
MIDHQSEIKNLKELFLKEVRQHVYMFDEFMLNWSVEIIEKTYTDQGYRFDNTDYELRFMVINKKNNKQRQVTIYNYNIEDWNTNPLRLLQDVVFNWDLTKINNYFND